MIDDDRAHDDPDRQHAAGVVGDSGDEAGLAARLDQLDGKLDTMAGAVAALARSQTDLVDSAAEAEVRRGHAAADVTQRLDALERQVLQMRLALERIEARTDDRLAALRDAANVPVADLGALLTARTDHVTEALAEHTDTALAGMLRLLDERLSALRAAFHAAAGPPAATGQSAMGFEAGAVMGAAQAAWNRLEQRLDTDFDELDRRLAAMTATIERALSTAEAAVNRPVVTGEQIRKTAGSVRDAVLEAARRRRQRRSGPQSLGPGSGEAGPSR